MEMKKRLQELVKDGQACPFTVVGEFEPLYVGIYLNAGAYDSYECGVDNGKARGGTGPDYLHGVILNPCSLEFAKTCPLYLKRIEGTTFKK